jgi:hypothetical protein
MIFAAATLSAQERVAVLPPQGGRNVTEINKKTVRSSFLDCISEPGSGYLAHDRNSTDLAVAEPGGRTSMLYDEKTARDVGRKLGVQLVCIIDLTRDEKEFLIECKLISVDTGLARSKSEIVSGITNAEIKKASETVARRLITRGLTIATDSAPAAKPAVADHAAASKTAAPANTTTKTTSPPATKPPAAKPPAAKPLLDNKYGPPFDTMWVVGFSIASPTGNAESTVNKIDDFGMGHFSIGYGASCSFEMKYFRARAEITYFSKRPATLYSYAVAAEGMYRFNTIDSGLYFFGGAAGIKGDAYFKFDLPSNFEPAGFGLGFSAGLGYNFYGQFGVEASYTMANKIIESSNLEWAQVSLRFRF